MKDCKQKFGVTLVEILVVVVVVAILAGMVIGLARRIDNQGKEQLVRNTFEILNGALEQFADYDYRYKDPNYAGFGFPLDCDGFDKTDLEAVLFDAMDATDVFIAPVDAARPIFHTNPDFSGCEVMYFLLSQVPACRETLDKIDKSLLTDKDVNGNRMKIIIDGRDYPLLRVVDCWGTTLRYDYYYEVRPPLNQTQIDDMKASKKAFPVITSAGPDKTFDTADDISSR